MRDAPVVFINRCCCDVQYGQTALMFAVGWKHIECVSILVANGADVNMAMKVLFCKCVQSTFATYICFGTVTMLISVEIQP